MEKKVEGLAAPIAVELGVDILHVELGGRHRSKYVKVVIDSVGSVDSSCLADFSRALSLQLDAISLFDGRYQLEVTSPGLNWPLSTKADFLRHRGEWIQARYFDGHIVEGMNLGPTKDGFRIKERDATEHVVVMEKVAKCVRSINWKALPSGKTKKDKKKTELME
ncbi:MAG: ribosome maturation factor RimP [Mariprofundaceae bacterium]